MTKIVTATVAVRLAEHGVLDLDAPVAGHVPALRQARPAQWASRITARHLLSHSAGLPNPIPVRWVHPAGEPGPDPGAFLHGLLARHGRLRFEPGARSGYSNLGPLVMAAALATATGKPFTELVSDEILGPLGMHATAFTVTPHARPRAAVGYHPRLSPTRLLLPRWAIGEPAGRWISLRPFLVDGPAYGGLAGPADELARFLQLHLRDGELDGNRILSAEAAAAMHRITVRGRRYDLGLGWFRPASRATQTRRSWSTWAAAPGSTTSSASTQHAAPGSRSWETQPSITSTPWRAWHSRTNPSVRAAAQPHAPHEPRTPHYAQTTVCPIPIPEPLRSIKAVRVRPGVTVRDRLVVRGLCHYRAAPAT